MSIWGQGRTIAVSENHIDDSIRSNSSHCMIAEAIKTAVPGALYVSVDLATIRYTDPTREKRYVFLTPRSAQQQLLAFDHGDEIPPFKFRLPTAAMVLEGGSHRKRKATVVHGRAGRDKKHANVPVRVGGQGPPRGPLSADAKVKTGARRAYGLRALA